MVLEVTFWLGLSLSYLADDKELFSDLRYPNGKRLRAEYLMDYPFWRLGPERHATYSIEVLSTNSQNELEKSECEIDLGVNI